MHQATTTELEPCFATACEMPRTHLEGTSHLSSPSLSDGESTSVFLGLYSGVVCLRRYEMKHRRLGSDGAATKFGDGIVFCDTIAVVATSHAGTTFPKLQL